MKCEIFKVYGTESDIATFARRSRGDRPGSPERDANLCRSLLALEHGTPFEIASIVWDITAPRYVADQFLRYRHATPNVMSLRACAPPKLNEVEPSERAWYQTCYDEYYRRRALGQSAEQARVCLPLLTPTTFYLSTSVRELQHIFEQRISSVAEEATRRLAETMHRKAMGIFPNCFYKISYRSEALDDDTGR